MLKLKEHATISVQHFLSCGGNARGQANSNKLQRPGWDGRHYIYSRLGECNRLPAALMRHRTANSFTCRTPCSEQVLP